jgi:type I restriction enzyme R subunit
MTSGDYSEDVLIEQPAIALFSRLGWKTKNCFHERFGTGDKGSGSYGGSARPEAGGIGRENSAEVVIVPRLRDSLRRLNPKLPGMAINQAIEALTRDRSAMSAVKANQEVYRLLKDGVRVSFNIDGSERAENVKVIDWSSPKNNDFFLASQLWITGEIYKRRADLVGFVNGIPLVFIELKATHKRLENAFENNLRDYKNTIPQLFWYNALIILSNGHNSRIGSITSHWDHFSEWKRINDEGEQGIVSLETMIKGTCDQERLLDLVESFILFQEASGGTYKIVAKNHQYLGVNRALLAVEEIKENQGRLGVFWHTQGSGKSFSMVFFSQKVQRKVPGNYTFVIITDRDELDEQIYKNFAGVGAVIEPEKAVRAKSAEHLKRLLQEDHRYVFTLIQKFRTERGGVYPPISHRSDIIVMADEAHRSQYDIFAQNMRNALPNAAFIGFTGTPLMVGEEKTRQIFGDYVSIYNFRQAIEDSSTLPLYYENRAAPLKLVNPRLNEEIYRIIEDADLDEDQEKKLERELSQDYYLITRDDRLEDVAGDIVKHFVNRGFLGKAMVVAIDKATAVKMYDKVKKHWASYQDDLSLNADRASGAKEKELMKKVQFMRETDMAVVVSQSQNEVEDFKEMGLDILPHRKRMIKEDLDKKFKDPKDPFRLVFVCAMWITGFDAPSCSTIYLDKPMKNHTLMQTIARANRVFPKKANGLIVDYGDIFKDLKKALAIYGSGSNGGVAEGDTPIKDKKVQIEELRQAILDTSTFCLERGVDPAKIQAAKAGDFRRAKLLDDSVEAIVVSTESKRRFLALAMNVNKLYKAILPDPQANEFSSERALFAVIAERILSLTPKPDISEVVGEIESLLDESIEAEGYTLDAEDDLRIVDLSQVDFDKLKCAFKNNRKNTVTESLVGAIESKIEQLVALNRTRIDYMAKFQEMIDEYNRDACNKDTFFENLLRFVKDLSDEEKRALKENLTEEELTVFDLLTKPEVKLNSKETNEVRRIARDLLRALKEEKLVLDWRKHMQSRATVKICIEEMLDQLPRAYTKELYQEKCEVVYQHVFDSYYGSGQSVYA